jgi:hypothetical protein
LTDPGKGILGVGRSPGCARISGDRAVEVRMTDRDAGEIVGNRPLRRRCQALVDRLELPEPFDIRALVDAVGTRRGRPIHLIAMREPLAPVCGVWLSTSDFDAIFYEAATSPLHREHIIAHELGHLLAEHEAPATMTDDVAQVLLPDLDPALVRRALNRSNYTTAEEREAEMFASLLSLAASRRGRTASWVAPPQVADVFARLEGTLEQRPRG